MYKFVIFAVFFAVPLFGMKDVSIDENPQSIVQDTKKMLLFCKMKCSITTDILQACTNSCLKDYSQQKERFLIRKYTARCADIPFTEVWSYKEENDHEGIISDLKATNIAYSKWENIATKNCVQAHLKLFNKMAHNEIKKAQNGANKFEHENPYTAKVVDFIRKIRRVE